MYNFDEVNLKINFNIIWKGGKLDSGSDPVKSLIIALPYFARHEAPNNGTYIFKITS